jgi:hypothetical protein
MDSTFELDRDVLSAIHARSAGNPLYIQKILEWLLLQRLDANSAADTSYTANKDSSQRLATWLVLNVPVTKMLYDTIDRLPAMQQMTLRVAAVMGAANISAFVLASIHPIARSAEEIVTDLNGLVAAGVLTTCPLPFNHFALGTPAEYLIPISPKHEVRFAAGRSGESEDWRSSRPSVLHDAATTTFMFITEQLRDTVLDVVPFEFRGNLHAQLASVFAELHDGGTDSSSSAEDADKPTDLERPHIPAATIAYHWEKSSLTAVIASPCRRTDVNSTCRLPPYPDGSIGGICLPERVVSLNANFCIRVIGWGAALRKTSSCYRVVGA